MRVITGSCKGRVLKTAAGLTTRPTSDMLKGMLFNILSWRSEGVQVLDLCAGCGALGIEALSRGASFATFIEADKEALLALRMNLKNCRLEEQSEVLSGDVLRLLPAWRPSEKVQLVFFDPPYQSTLYHPVLRMLSEVTWLAPEAIIVVEHHKNERIEAQVGRLNRYRETGHGLSRLSFYQLRVES